MSYSMAPRHHDKRSIVVRHDIQQIAPELGHVAGMTKVEAMVEPPSPYAMEHDPFATQPTEPPAYIQARFDENRIKPI